MKIGTWILLLFVTGTALTVTGAFVTSWWLFGPGVAMVAGCLALTAADREAGYGDDPWSWPR